MKYILKRKDKLSVAAWAGGSTTELFLFPLDASYKERNFEVRISSATVDVSPSAFSALPAYRRVLMPLSAPLRLVFEDGLAGCLELAPFEAAEFEGGWKTSSCGIFTDIGIMLSPDWQGSLFVPRDGVYGCGDGFFCVYALCDNVAVTAGESDFVLMKGDFLVLENDCGKNAEVLFALPSENSAVVAVVKRK